MGIVLFGEWRRMKQRITTKQLNELSEKGKKRLRKWWKEKKIGDISEWKQTYKAYKYTLPLFNIGQMIEFLGDEWFAYISLQNKDDLKQFMVAKPEAICDALWLAVKEILND